MIKSPSTSLFIAIFILWSCFVGTHAFPSTTHIHRSLVRRRECLNGEGAGPSGAPAFIRSEVCTDDSECASGLCCDNPDGSITCRGKGFGSSCKINAECGDNFCDDSFTCQSASASVDNPLGSRCSRSSDRPCAGRLYCEDDEICTRPSVYLELGEKCERSGPCVSNFCAGGVCVNPRETVITEQGLGERCFEDSHCKTKTCDESAGECIEAAETCGSGPGCETGTVCEEGNCIASGLRDDEGCDFSSQCQIGSCHNNKCRLPVEESGACDETSDCIDGSLACVGNICTRGGRPANTGGFCTVGSGCLSGICENSVCVETAGKTPNGGGCDTDNNCVSGICNENICEATEPSTGKGGLGSDCDSPDNCLSNVCSEGKCIAEIRENETNSTPALGNNGSPQTVISTVNGQRQTVTVTPSGARVTGARVTSSSTGSGQAVARVESGWIGIGISLVGAGAVALL